MRALWQVLALWVLRRKKPRVCRLVELFCLAVPAGDALCRWQVIVLWPMCATLPTKRTSGKLLSSAGTAWQPTDLAELHCTSWTSTLTRHQLKTFPIETELCNS